MVEKKVIYGKIIGAWDQDKLNSLLNNEKINSESKIIEILLDESYDISKLMFVEKVKIII